MRVLVLLVMMEFVPKCLCREGDTRSKLFEFLKLPPVAPPRPLLEDLRSSRTPAVPAVVPRVAICEGSESDVPKEQSSRNPWGFENRSRSTEGATPSGKLFHPSCPKYGSGGRILGGKRSDVGALKVHRSFWDNLMDICREDRTDKRETAPIDQSAQFVPFSFLIAIITGRSPFLAGISLVSVEQWVRSIFRIS